MADALTSPTRFHVLTIFPAMFASPFAEGIMARAIANGLVEVRPRDIRDHARDNHRTVDDYPFGGGPGMLMKAAPLFDAVEAARSSARNPDCPVILLSPQGRPLTQAVVEELARVREMVLVCGRYEGVDERVRDHLVTDEISIGDYVLSGGELAAMVLIDAVCRLLPGVVGSIASTEDDSFTTGPHPAPAVHPARRVQGLARARHAALRQPRRHRALAQARVPAQDAPPPARPAEYRRAVQRRREAPERATTRPDLPLVPLPLWWEGSKLSLPLAGCPEPAEWVRMGVNRRCTHETNYQAAADA